MILIVYLSQVSVKAQNMSWEFIGWFGLVILSPLASLVSISSEIVTSEGQIKAAASQPCEWLSKTKDVLNQAFFRMDSDGDGFIDRDEWSSMIKRLVPGEGSGGSGGTGWTGKVLQDMFARLDKKRDRRLDYEEFVSRLLENDTEGHKLVKEIVLTPPSQEDGAVGLFGPLLLKGTAYKEFPIGTLEALQDSKVIGLIFMTSSTVDKQLYPTSLLQLNKTLLQRLAQLYLDLRNPEIEEKPTEKLEVVLCSFDTTWEAFTRTVGRPGPPAPWMVMPFDSPWERDHLWRKLRVRFKHQSDPALVILKPNLEVITVKGFADLDVPRKLLFRVFSEWVAEASEAAPETVP